MSRAGPAAEFLNYVVHLGTLAIILPMRIRIRQVGPETALPVTVISVWLDMARSQAHKCRGDLLGITRIDLGNLVALDQPGYQDLVDLNPHDLHAVALALAVPALFLGSGERARRGHLPPSRNV